jgi:hypothetical protein
MFVSFETLLRNISDILRCSKNTTERLGMVAHSNNPMHCLIFAFHLKISIAGPGTVAGIPSLQRQRLGGLLFEDSPAIKLTSPHLSQ